MNTISPDCLADEWIAYWSSATPRLDFARLDSELADVQPALCLASIMTVLRGLDAARPGKLMAALAAGPLEDLLVKYGDVVVDQVELLARQDAAFRMLLNGVWVAGLKPEVREKLARYCTQPW